MGEVLSDILTVSIQGGIVILAVMVLRLVLKKAPKSAICLLWLLAGLRLLLPFQIESSFSLQPNRDVVTRLEWTAAESEIPPARGEILDKNGNVIVKQEPSVPAKGEILDKNGEVLVEKPLSPAEAPAKINWDWEKTILLIWLAGVLAMGLYTAVSYAQLKRKVSDAVILEEGVWAAGGIDTAFVLGFLRPQIYLSANMTEREREFVLAHERAHIARRDHWWKLLGFGALALHWFNPLVWVGYVLLCRDLEMACDETVVKSMDVTDRKAYSAALVSCSAIHHSIAACPVAFGEVSVKERVNYVLRFKKPGFWITVLAVIAAVFVAVFFLTSPGNPMEEKAVESLYSELEALQAQEDLYMSVSIRNESEYDYFYGQEQEFRKSGEDWYRVIAQETREGTYSEHYLQIGDTQYVSRESEQIPRLESQDWFIMPEEYELELYPLLTRDWTQCEVLEVREEISRDDGGVYTVLIQGDLEGDSKTTYYEHTHAFHLDENFRLVGMEEYSSSDRYMEGFDGTSGRFDMESWTLVRFREADAEENETVINEAMQAALTAVEETYALSQAELEALLERKEAERLAKGIPPDLLWQCKRTVEEFQSRDNICVLAENRFSGDIVNDSSTVEYFKNGKDWLLRTTISCEDFTESILAMEKDGAHFERHISEVTNPANGPGIDTGWVAELEDGEFQKPWLSTVNWDDLLITSVEQKTEGDMTRVTMTVYGSPYELEEGVTEYQVTFLFRDTSLSQVVLEYTKTWGTGEEHTGHVVTTIDPNYLAVADAEKQIEELYARKEQ